MQLRTELQPLRADWSIDHHTPLLSLGSCFADRMGQRLRDHKFNILVNPFGVIYHPLPLLRLLQLCLTDSNQVFEDSLFAEEEQVKSLLLHSQFGSSSREEAVEMWGELKQATLSSLYGAGVLLLTLGTAHGFRHLEKGYAVANCHRLPAREFRQELTPLSELKNAFSQTLALLRTHFPKLKVVLTVSPVRHIRTGIPENSVGKSVLRLLAHEMARQDLLTSYFPAFELMVDDLRDYRFYARDLVHPSELAEDYIWEHFGKCHFDSATRELNGELEAVFRDLNHRPRNPKSKGHRQFLENLRSKISRCAQRVNLDQEMNWVNAQLQRS